MAPRGWLMGRSRWLAAAVVPAVLISACGSPEDSPTDGAAIAAGEHSAADTAPSFALPLQTQNHGGSMEGHTPRGFAGSGTGLFIGDNLNPGFPDGEGVQIWLSFDLSDATPSPARAVLRSQALTVRGNPFADLGALQAEPVSYDSFSPELFDDASTGAAVTCKRVGDRGIECDVTDAVARAIDVGEDRAQFRLKFERAGDNDGEADLAMFFLTDSNTNERGIFTLDLT
jgi:hypothetical protein